MTGSASSSIHWVLTGAGDVCERKGGPPLHQLPGHSLLAAYRRDRTEGEDFARRHGCRYAASMEELLAIDEADAVYVATPPEAHLEHTLAAAAAGKHVLVEKPMAMDSGECARMVEACREAGVVLGVAYYRRCYPSVPRAKELLDGGAVGTLREIEINDRFPPSHRLDLLHFFGGPIARLRSETRELPATSHTERGERLLGEFRGEGGFVTNIGWHESGPPERVWIRGDEGEIFIEDLKGGSLVCNGARETFAPPPWTHWGLVENFGRHLAGEAPPACPGEEGRKSTVALDVASTLRPGGDPVEVDYDHPPDPDALRAGDINLLG